MSSHKKEKKQPVKVQSPLNNQVQSKTLFESLEKHFSTNQNFYKFFLVGCALLFSILLFDIKVSTANDDSLYIEAGAYYAKDFFGYFYTANAPLYPMFLALPISIFGVNLFVLKALSVLFFVWSVWLLFQTFKNRIPFIVLVPALFIMTTNHLFLIHASLTYTEAFFSLIQAWFLWLFFKLLDKNEQHANHIKHTWKLWVVFGFSLYIQYMTRNLGLGTVLMVFMFFAIRKEFLNALYTILSFGIFTGVWTILKNAIWGAKSQLSGQGSLMFQKDVYDASKGKEDFSGLVTRFFENTDIYFSSKLWEALGFRGDFSTTDTMLTMFTIAFLLFGLYMAFKKGNRAVIVTTLYYGVLCAVTFVSLHTFWGQARLIMIFIPFIFISVFYGLFAVLNSNSRKGLQFLFLVVFAIITIKNFGTTLSRAGNNMKVLSKNVKGDIYYGYTDDWVNYLKMSRWCADSLPENSFVACRKAQMSFVYGNGKSFYPVWNAPYKDADSLLNLLQNAKVTHIIQAKLRTNPAVYNPQGYINTIDRYLQPIAQKYEPVFNQMFRKIRQEGIYEEAILYEIHYDVRDKFNSMRKDSTIQLIQ